MLVGKNGLIIYVLSPKRDRLAIFERHPQSGEVKEWPESPRTTEPKPMQVTIDPAGRHVFMLSKNNMLSSYRGREGQWPLLDQIDMQRKFGKDNSKLTALTTDPLGNFIYAADSANDEILVYWINTSTGIFEDARKPSFKVGATPIAMNVHPTGNWMYVANEKANTIETYRVDNIFGALEEKVQTVNTSKSLRSLRLDATGRFAYVTYEDSRKISLFAIDTKTGLLSHQKDLLLESEIADYVLDSYIE